jgi:hypothetical protein
MVKTCEVTVVPMSIIQSGLSKWLEYMVAAILLTLCLAFLTAAALDLVPFEGPATRQLMIGLLLPCTALMTYLGYDVTTYPTRIVVHPDRSFVLHSPLREVCLQAAQVSEVGCDMDGDYYLRYANRKADLRFFRREQLAAFLDELRTRHAAPGNESKQRQNACP